MLQIYVRLNIFKYNYIFKYYKLNSFLIEKVKQKLLLPVLLGYSRFLMKLPHVYLLEPDYPPYF